MSDLGSTESSAPNADWIAQAIQDHVRNLTLPAWPVFGCSTAGQEGWLSGAGEDDAALVSLRISYHPPDDPERLVVETQAQGQATVPVAQLLQWALDGDEDDYPTGGEDAHQPDDATAEIEEAAAVVHADGEVVRARSYRVDGCWVIRASLYNVTVTVSGRGIDPDGIELTRIRDLGPLKAARDAVISRAESTASDV